MKNVGRIAKTVNSLDEQKSQPKAKSREELAAEFDEAHEEIEKAKDEEVKELHKKYIHEIAAKTKEEKVAELEKVFEEAVNDAVKYFKYLIKPIIAQTVERTTVENKPIVVHRVPRTVFLADGEVLEWLDDLPTHPDTQESKE